LHQQPPKAETAENEELDSGIMILIISLRLHLDLILLQISHLNLISVLHLDSLSTTVIILSIVLKQKLRFALATILLAISSCCSLNLQPLLLTLLLLSLMLSIDTASALDRVSPTVSKLYNESLRSS
jgi:hypothetical protein